MWSLFEAMSLRYAVLHARRRYEIVVLLWPYPENAGAQPFAHAHIFQQALCAKGADLSMVVPSFSAVFRFRFCHFHLFTVSALRSFHYVSRFPFCRFGARSVSAIQFSVSRAALRHGYSVKGIQASLSLSFS